MLLESVVEISRRISEASKRLGKIDLLANLLRQLRGEEIDIVVSFLSARTRQGRIGVAYAALRDAAADPAESATLEVLEVDRAFAEIAATRGTRARVDLLRRLLARSTQAEQQFLTGLIGGELRQGALEGIMIDDRAVGFLAFDQHHADRRRCHRHT